MTRDQINAALAPYGAYINEAGFIQKGEKATSVRVVVAKGRLRFEGMNTLLATSRLLPESVAKFVESFWYWKPNAS